MSLEEMELKSFITLKTAVITPPILATFLPDAPKSVETDALYDGLGACLTQIQNDKLRIIEYASRSLKDTEKRHHSNKLEVTAVHWVVTEKFSLY